MRVDPGMELLKDDILDPGDGCPIETPDSGGSGIQPPDWGDWGYATVMPNGDTIRMNQNGNIVG